MISPATLSPAFPDIDFGITDLPDFFAIMESLRSSGKRAIPVRYMGEVAFLLVRHADVYRAYRDSKHLPSAAAYAKTHMNTMGRTIQCMDGPEHKVTRALVSSSFLPSVIRAYAERLLRPLANELIDGFDGRFELDIMEAYCLRYPLLVIMRMLGLPDCDEKQMFSWLGLLTQYSWKPVEALKAKEAVTEYLLPVIRARRARPEGDIISRLATAEIEGERLDDEAVLSIVRLLFPAGADTTYIALGNLLNSVLGDLSVRDRLIAAPDLVAAAVEEGLRMAGPVGLLPRYTESGFTLGEETIPPHSVVLLSMAPADRDPDIHIDPNKFDLDRKSNRLLAFGGGSHFCLGSHLARAELNISLELLLKRLPGLRLSEGPKPIQGTVLRRLARLPVAFDAVMPAIA